MNWLTRLFDRWVQTKEPTLEEDANRFMQHVLRELGPLGVEESSEDWPWMTDPTWRSVAMMQLIAQPQVLRVRFLQVFDRWLCVVHPFP